MSKIKTAIYLYKADRRAFKIALAQLVAKTKFSHIIPDKFFLSIQYKATFEKKLNLRDPKTFNEKLQWLKLYDRRSEYNTIVDKYEVKKYVSDIIGDEYIIPTLGVWNKFDDIAFEKLPDKFVLKCTHDSGSVILCRDKAVFDVDNAKTQLSQKMKSNLFWHGREWPYKDVRPRIIAEKYMENGTDNDLSDYKFYCFGGEPKFLYLSRGLSNHATAKISYVTLDWTKAPFKRTDFAEFDELPDKPLNFEKMIEFSRALSKDIPFLRVDFYEINGALYFGELTFFPGAGFTAFNPSEWDEKIGELLVLPEKEQK